jgi:cysteine desulfurase
MPEPIYLDNAATTPLDPAVADGLAHHLRETWGNPASGHRVGRAAGAVLADARRRLSRSLGTAPERVLFTSGGTESLGVALFGLALSLESPGRVARSAIEHSAVRTAAEALVAHHGWARDVVPVDRQGRVTPGAIAETVGPDTRIVAVMLGNNEIGTLQDIGGLIEAARARAPRARFVVDAVQGLGKIPLDVEALGADCVAVTAHKLHGPKGIGALWTRRPLTPHHKGGGQEGGVRGGTQSAALAWAFAEAAERAVAGVGDGRLAALRDALEQGLLDTIDGAERTITDAPRLPHVAHLLIPGLPSEPLLNALSAAGVCASAGSACGRAGGKQLFSPVLTALGRRAEEGAWLRLSVGRQTTEADVATALPRIRDAVEELRAAYG